MGTLASIILLGCVLAAVFHSWPRLFEDPVEARRSLTTWSVKGTLPPLALWILFNLDFSASLQPLWPAVRVLKATGMSAPHVFLAVALTGFFVVASFWSAVTLGWMMTLIAFRTCDRLATAGFAAIGSLVLGPIAGVMIYYGGILKSGLALSLWLAPIVHFTVADARIRKRAPMYSRAIARLKFGKYHEAETEVIRELEKYENDFDGWMMLAELYARNFRDLAQADCTIRELCDQPGVQAVQISTALNRLADWHLSLGNDPDAACAALTELCRKLPNTHAARMARQRLSQLPVTREALQKQRDRKTVPLPAALASFEDLDAPATSKLSREDAVAVANDYVKMLQRDPNNSSARERFAVALAEQVGKPDLAIEQLELLLAMPGASEKKIAEWLGLIAAWQLKFRSDEPAARRIFERLVQEYPQTPQAFAAQRRLTLMEVERRTKAAWGRLEPPRTSG